MGPLCFKVLHLKSSNSYVPLAFFLILENNLVITIDTVAVICLERDEHYRNCDSRECLTCFTVLGGWPITWHVRLGPTKIVSMETERSQFCVCVFNLTTTTIWQPLSVDLNLPVPINVPILQQNRLVMCHPRSSS